MSVSVIILILTGCGLGEGGYIKIDQETVKERMETDDGQAIVDVRTKEEYESGHSPGSAGAGKFVNLKEFISKTEKLF